MKIFVENLISKRSEFYSREIKLSDKWKEVMENNGESTID